MASTGFAYSDTGESLYPSGLCTSNSTDFTDDGVYAIHRATGSANIWCPIITRAAGNIIDYVYIDVNDKVTACQLTRKTDRNSWRSYTWSSSNTSGYGGKRYIFDWDPTAGHGTDYVWNIRCYANQLGEVHGYYVDLD